jgi:hypothetical protein
MVTPLIVYLKRYLLPLSTLCQTIFHTCHTSLVQHCSDHVIKRDCVDLG